MKLALQTGCGHAEAFCLMLYRTDDGSEEEWLWNSRDGVTSFGVTSKGGHSMLHVDWERDRFLPMHVPEVGDRIFIDLTETVARAYAAEQVERDYEDMKEHPYFEKMTRDEMVANRAKGMLEFGGGGAPDVIVVNSAMQRAFRDRSVVYTHKGNPLLMPSNLNTIRQQVAIDTLAHDRDLLMKKLEARTGSLEELVPKEVTEPCAQCGEHDDNERYVFPSSNGAHCTPVTTVLCDGCGMLLAEHLADYEKSC